MRHYRNLRAVFDPVLQRNRELNPSMRHYRQGLKAALAGKPEMLRDTWNADARQSYTTGYRDGLKDLADQADLQHALQEECEPEEPSASWFGEWTNLVWGGDYGNPDRVW